MFFNHKIIKNVITKKNIFLARKYFNAVVRVTVYFNVLMPLFTKGKDSETLLELL